MAGQYMQRAATRDYTKWWQKERTFPWFCQQVKPPLGDRPGNVVDNYLRCVYGKQPFWMPAYGWEYNTVWPDAMEECAVPEVEGYDWWGVLWTNSSANTGMITKPGTRAIKDFENWKEEVEVPDLSVVDFETDGKKIQTVQDPDRVHIYECVKGCFERLHEMMPFDETLMAFYTEPELLEDFFQMVADYKIDSMTRIFKYYGRIDGICYHDDWGTARAGFFSYEMLENQILPATKRIFDFVHEQGKFVEMHSCGRNMAYVPLMIEMGVNQWTPQANVNDMDYLYDTYGKDMTFTIPLPLAANLSEEERNKLIHEFVDRYGETGRMMCALRCENMADMPAAQQELVNYSYEYYNKLYNR
ncbi:MAG: methyltransferase [Eubacterium sp.]|nr:methyltransferase [Eubacterium sp.]